MNDLIIRLTGAITESNFEAWKESALEQIKSADRSLQTDEDFSWAEDAIKAFKAGEKSLKDAKQRATDETQDIALLFSAMDKISGAMAKTRLALEKQVKVEKDRRKNDIIDAGIERIEKELQNIVAGTAFNAGDFVPINELAVTEATANKKSLKGMQDAVDAVVETEVNRLVSLVSKAIRLKAEIDQTEAVYPGLFPDAKQLSATKSRDEVNAIMTARIAEFKLKTKEKNEREAEERKRIEEQKRNNDAENQLPEQPLPPTVFKEQPKIHGQDTKPETQHLDSTHHAAPEANYVFAVNLKCTREQAIGFAKSMSDSFGADGRVMNFKLTNGV